MEWLSVSHCQWILGSKNSYVYLSARDVGRLDKKYLSWLEGQAILNAAGCIWGTYPVGGCAHSATLAVAGGFLVPSGWRGGSADNHPRVINPLGNYYCCKGESCYWYGSGSLVCVYISIGG